MDLSADPRTPSPHTALGGHAVEQEPTLSSACCQTESGGTLLLQLLEFKTHLLEAVEELHIRKDAETRFEDHVSKLVLEKQELKWEKESLQHQIETAVNQHTESLASVKKQFQARIRNIEEERGKYQVSAELKDKEINNLKEELRSLQLLKYNLEKKSNELEQKLALQSRSKDSHLNQLGEAEKRFSAVSRLCATVKQAHQQLEQNVDEAMRINKKLISANEKQEATIESLGKELEEVNKKLIKAKMASVIHEKTQCATGQEQHIQKLHQRLNMETEMNKKLREENECVRAEKQEVMRSLQQAQQLLLSQTHTVNRAELELQTQRQQHQALKQEHEVMRDKSKAMEDKVAQLMESYATSTTSWDKEKEMFISCMESKQRDLQAARDAHAELRQKHAELSSLADTQAQHIRELEMRNSSQSLSVSSQVFPPKEPASSSELSGSGSPQHLASSQTRNPHCLEEDTGAVAKLVATGTAGGHETSNLHQQLFQQTLNPSDLFKCPLSSSSTLSPCTYSGTDSDNSTPSKSTEKPETSENRPDAVSASADAPSSGSDDELTISKGASVNQSAALLSKDQSEDRNGGVFQNKHGGEEDGGREESDRKEEERNSEQQWNGEEVKGEDEQDGGTRGPLADSQGSAQEAGATRSPKTETRDRAERPGADGAGETGERGETAACAPAAPETQIQGQTTAGSQTRAVTDPTRHNAEPLAQRPSPVHQALDSAVDFPLSQSAVCSSQTDGTVITRDPESSTPQTVPNKPCDITNDMKQVDETSERELRSLVPSDDDGADPLGACRKEVNTNKRQAEPESRQGCDKTQDQSEAKAAGSETDLQLSVHQSGPRASSDPVSVLHQCVQGPGKIPSLSGGRLRHPPRPTPMFPRSRQSKVSLAISGASDLLNASSVSGRSAASSPRALGQTCGETTAAAPVSQRTCPTPTTTRDPSVTEESRVSVSITSFPATASSTVSRLSWQRIPGSSRAAASQCDWEPSCSQEREDQQALLRAQISRIEQFLSTEGLSLPKRQKTDN